LRSLPSTLLHFSIPRFLFSFLFFLSPRPLAQDTSAITTPAPLSHSSVAALPWADTLRPAPAVAALLNASGLSTEGPSPLSTFTPSSL
jgi:hypothetical protein